MAHKKIQGAGSLVQRRQLLDEENSELPRKRQCELLSLHRSGTYYKPRAKADETPIEKALNELTSKTHVWACESFLIWWSATTA